MKINKAVTETIINYIYLVFEKDSDLGEFEILLIRSGASEKEAPSFICKKKINYQKIEKRMASDNNFFLSLASNLLPYLVKEQRAIFQGIMKKFGYILGTNKTFRKGTKTELVELSNVKEIRKIEIYKDESDRFRVCVNNKMLSWTKPKQKTDKPYWQYIYEVAVEEKSYVDRKRVKGVVGWFRSDKENPIYKETGLKPTKILEYRDDFLYASPNVEIRKMSQKKAYSQKTR